MKRLLDIMARLRDPQSGCPWDREQTFRSIVPYTLEEAYEVADAIEREDFEDLRDELGDLLFQVAFYTQMASEQGRFDFEQVVEAICEKMIRRHPHVFADAQVRDAAHQSEAWEKHKAAERAVKKTSETEGYLSSVTRGLPALLRAQKLQKRAAKVGFDWENTDGVMIKLQEELQELQEAMTEHRPAPHVEEELGDLLFSCVNLARHLEVDAEEALRQANNKFERRFHGVEQCLAGQGRDLEQSDLTEMDRLWDQVKAEENDTSEKRNA